MANKIIPVTILTWFLWSGKTSLLNHILNNKKGYKIAVIENEFWEEWIDGDLIESSVEEIIEIQNGCMCCSLRWDFISGVKKLLDSGKEFDYLIIEASGVSEPLPIAQTFLIEDFWGRVKLDSIVCLVDAQNFRHHLVSSLQTSFEQIEYANFVILNKIDTSNPEEIETIKKTIKELNKYCVIIETNYGKVDLQYILDTTSFEMTEEIEKEFSHRYEHKKHTQDDHHEHHHHEIEQYLFKTNEKCYHLENLKTFLGELSDDIFRIKGFIHFKDIPDKRFILQKTGSSFTLQEDIHWDEKEQSTRIIFIGKDLNKNDLQDALLHTVFFNL